MKNRRITMSILLCLAGLRYSFSVIGIFGFVISLLVSKIRLLNR